MEEGGYKLAHQSSYYQPGPFSADEQFCLQFCDWYMQHSSHDH